MSSESEPLCASGLVGSALAAFQRVLGEEHVLADRALIASYEMATFETAQRIVAVLRPSSSEQVRHCVEIANTFHVPLYPISGGKQWGYGSRVPARDGCAVLDLKRLDRIVDFDETMGTVVVEPGVTFGQLSAYLRQTGSRWVSTRVGAGPEASLIGNLLERGHGFGRTADRLANACAYEVVLPTGECLRTGFARYSNAATASLVRGGVGPSLQELFAQSNLGIVTRMTIWLERRPKHYQVAFFGVHEKNRLPGLIDALRELIATRVITDNAVAVFNQYRALTGVQQYPWDKTQKTPLSPNLAGQLACSHGLLLPWAGIAVLGYESRAEMRACRRTIRRGLRGSADRVVFVDSVFATIAHAVRWPVKALLGIDLGVLLSTYEQMSPGRMFERLELAMYWRKKTPAPAVADPERDRCGIVWSSVFVPFDGNHVMKAVAHIEETCPRHGFEPYVNLLVFDERSLLMPTPVYYDREISGEDERAMVCERELTGRLIADGYYPWRLGISQMSALPKPLDDSAAVWARIKKALDPNGIMAPGRYEL